MAEVPETADAARLGLIAVDRVGVEAASAGMGDKVGTAAQYAIAPGIHDVENQRRIHANGRMQGRGRVPCFVANARHVLTLGAAAAERHPAAVADQDVAIFYKAAHFHL